MRRSYPPAIEAFIAGNYLGIRTKALAEKINATFGTSYTASQIRAYKSNRGLKSGVKPGSPATYYSKLFPREICEFICANCKGVGPMEMASRVNARFGTAYKVSQVESYYANHGLISGVTGRFEKGHPSHNKGKKGYYAAGSEKGWFEKGHMPQTHKPVGTESLRSDGYWWVKVAEPNKWREKHVLVWEAAHGKRPRGHIITFLDGNRSNFDLSNLELITMGENGVMARGGYRSDNAEFTKTGILLAKVSMARTAAKKKIKEGM